MATCIRAGDTLTPVMIDAHSYHRAVSSLISEFINADTAGSAFDLLVKIMIERSQRFIMRGKSILVLQGGGHSKKFVWESAKDYGIEARITQWQTLRVFYLPELL